MQAGRGDEDVVGAGVDGRRYACRRRKDADATRSAGTAEAVFADVVRVGQRCAAVIPVMAVRRIAMMGVIGMMRMLVRGCRSYRCCSGVMRQSARCLDRCSQALHGQGGNQEPEQQSLEEAKHRHSLTCLKMPQSAPKQAPFGVIVKAVSTLPAWEGQGSNNLGLFDKTST